MYFRTRMRVMGCLIILASAGSGMVPLTAWAQGDVAEGEEFFANCAICHSTKPGENKFGPSLAGVFGRKSGTAPGYTYSAAMKNLDVTWDETTLDEYLQLSSKMPRGTRMIYAVPNQKDRQDLIAYLKTLEK